MDLSRQLDLTDLVGIEHINGSMPAGAREREAAANDWYDALRAKAGRQRRTPHATEQQLSLDDLPKEGL